MGGSTISVDEFQALEQKVLQTVELIKKEREARHQAEADRDAAITEAAELRDRLQAQEDSTGSAHRELETMQRERESVRQRVEKMLAQMDELL